MLVVLLPPTGDALERLGRLRTGLSSLAARYEQARQALLGNAVVEGRLAALGYKPRHVVMELQALPQPISIHIMPTSTWLAGTLGEVTNNINRIVNQLGEAVKALAGLGNIDAFIAVFIDYRGGRTRLVVLP